MSPPPDGPAACRRVLEAALADPARLDPASLAAAPAAELEAALRDFADTRSERALPVLAALVARGAGDVRRAARRALYRLAQRGVAPPPVPSPQPVVPRPAPHAARAWLSGIDGSGSRAIWIVFDAGSAGLQLCSLIVNDTIGVVETAGGPVTKKRLRAELDALRASQKLPWVETDPEPARALVAEALALHATLGTAPPAAFDRWRPLFEAPAAAAPAAPAAGPGDPALADRSAALLELPELAGWFLDPDDLQRDALDLAETRASRLVVSDTVKAEREDAIVARVAEREFSPEVRRRWARRLREMALIFDAIARPEHAAIARATATALADEARDVTRLPLARAAARRGLELAAEVAAGRVRAADVSRKPVPGAHA